VTIKVFAAEHYCAANHGWSCSAAPIFNCNGVLVGALGVTAHCESFHLHTGGMIRAAVHAISEQLHLRALLGEQRTLMEMLDEGVVMLDADERICTMNKKATAMLNLKRDVIGQLFHELVRFRAPSRSVWKNG
jgi:transcriptional regulator of acetoin/glycerol metabolism